MSSAAIRQPIGLRLSAVGILLKLTFDTCYIYFVSPSFSYLGLTLSLNASKLVESYLAMLAILIVLGLRQRTPSTMILIVNTFIGVMPILSIYALQDRPREFAYAVVIMIFLSILLASLPRMQVLSFRISYRSFIFIGMLATVGTVLLIIAKGGLANFNLNLENVYAYREATASLVFSGVTAYLAHWVTAVLNVALIVWGIHRRNWTLVVAVTAMQVILFGLTSHRAVLFNLPFAVVIYVVLKRNHDIVAVGWLISILLGMGMCEAILLGSSHINDIIPQRVFGIPAFFAYEYYDLFNLIGHVYWTNSYASLWKPYPFDLEPQLLVARSAFGSTETWANNGMFGSGYMQAGFIGMLVYGTVYGLWLYLIDCIAVGRVPLEVAVAVLIIPVLNIATDVDLTTGLLTHGGFVATLMLWLWAGAVRPDRRAQRVAMGAALSMARRE